MDREVWERVRRFKVPKGTKRLVLFLLAYYAHPRDQGWAWPKMGTLAHDAGVDRRYLQDIVRGLEEEGFLKTIRRRGLRTWFLPCAGLDQGEIERRVARAQKAMKERRRLWQQRQAERDAEQAVDQPSPGTPTGLRDIGGPRGAGPRAGRRRHSSAGGEPPAHPGGGHPGGLSSGPINGGPAVDSGGQPPGAFDLHGDSTRSKKAERGGSPPSEAAPSSARKTEKSAGEGWREEVTRREGGAPPSPVLAPIPEEHWQAGDAADWWHQLKRRMVRGTVERQEDGSLAFVAAKQRPIPLKAIWRQLRPVGRESAGTLLPIGAIPGEADE